MVESKEHSVREAANDVPASSTTPSVPPVPSLDPEILAQAYQLLQARGQSAQPATVRTSKVSDRWISLSAQILRRCPKEFTGDEGVVAAQKWLREIKRHLEVLDCTPAEEIRLAVYRMTDGARAWWDEYAREIGDEQVANMSWADFCEIFEDKYIPEFAKLRMQEEYEALVQGSMSVHDYYQKFDSLSYYSQNEPTRSRIERFKKGLKPSIQHKVGHMRFSTLSQAVESASMAEHVNHRLQKEDGNKGKEKKAHRPHTSRFNGRCRNCGKYGHKYADCRSLPKS